MLKTLFNGTIMLIDLYKGAIMKITALIENTAKDNNLITMHGLSLYVQTSKHKILIDIGDGDKFLQNSLKLGVEISGVDIAIITHGHNDHGGGLKYFLDNNKKAKVYIQRTAFNDYFVKADKENYIGLDKSLINDPRIILLDGDYKISDEIFLVTRPQTTELMPGLNSMLYQKSGGLLENDKFLHEQSVFVADNKNLLVGGCAHSGIINIINNTVNKTKKQIDYCISGFHLFNPALNFTDFDVIESLSKKLLSTGINFYTCHCTGVAAYEKLKQLMGKYIEYLYTGKTVTL